MHQTSKFKTKRDDEDIVPPGTLTIKKEPSTAKTKAIENDLVDLKAVILQDAKVIAGSAGKVEPEVVNKNPYSQRLSKQNILT
nr:hypothetical protein [Acinetobacter baumannii]